MKIRSWFKPKERSKVIDEVTRLNAAADEWIQSLRQSSPDAKDVIVISVDRLDRVLTRLSLEFPNTDPELFNYLKIDLGVK